MECSRKDIKVLYISYNSISDPLLVSQGLSYIESLSNEYSFTLLTFESIYRDNFLSLRNRLKEKRINWIYYTICSNSFLPFKIFNYFLNSLRLAKVLLKDKEKFSIVHIRGYSSMFTFILSYLLLKILSPFKKIPKVVFDLRNPTMDEIIDSCRFGVYVKFFLQQIEKIMFKLSSALIVVSDKFRDYIFHKLKTFNIYNRQIFVVYNNVNLEQFLLTDKVDNRDSEHLRLVYIGVLDKYHPLEPMLMFF